MIWHPLPRWRVRPSEVLKLHVMLGSGFPSAEQLRVSGDPDLLMTKSEISVITGGSEGNKTRIQGSNLANLD